MKMSIAAGVYLGGNSIKENVQMTTLKKIAKRGEVGVLIPLLLLWVITGCFNKNFFSSMSMLSLFRSISVTLIGSVGATFVFSCGMMDLSIGAVYGLASMIACLLMTNLGTHPAIAILCGLAVAALFGLLNGFTINVLNLPAFISTLGTQYIGRGIVNVISGGKQVSGLPDDFMVLGSKGPSGIYWSIYIALIFAVIAALILKYTVYGRSLLAVGGNQETSRTCGINVRRVRNIAFVISSMMAALAGLLSTSRLGAVQATSGTGWEMTVIAATVIGGVSMYGGSASILGAAIGVAIMETLTVSMTMIRINAYWQNIVVGIIITVAVAIDTFRRKKLSGGKG